MKTFGEKGVCMEKNGILSVKRVKKSAKRTFFGPEKAPKNTSQKNHTPITHPLETTLHHVTLRDNFRLPQKGPSINLSRDFFSPNPLTVSPFSAISTLVYNKLYGLHNANDQGDIMEGEQEKNNGRRQDDDLSWTPRIAIPHYNTLIS